MQALRFIAAWLCYWTGHGVSKLMDPVAPVVSLYPLYNWLMVRSFEAGARDDEYILSDLGVMVRMCPQPESEPLQFEVTSLDPQDPLTDEKVEQVKNLIDAKLREHLDLLNVNE